MTYDNNSARLLIGCLMLNTQLINSEKYVLTNADFEPVEFHLRLFQAMKSLAKHGARICEPIDLYDTADGHSNIVALFDNNNLKDFCETIKQLANVDNVDYYYEEVRKCTILREYAKHGFDISKFENNVGNVSLKDIVDFYDGVQADVKKNFYKNKDITELKAGDGFENIKEQFMEDPMFGASTFSEYVNTATRGWINGQLSIYSCPSGCVDADTEFFDGYKWKKISEYNKGDKVLQYTDEGKAELVLPWSYFKEPCDKMYYFKTKYGISQMLSPEHTMVLYGRKFGQKREFTAEEFFNKTPNSRAEHRVKTSFEYGAKGIDLSDAEIKVMCATICDGYFRSGTNHCTFHIKKDRKKEELRKILAEAEIEFTEKKYNNNGYTEFFAYVPRREKEFGEYWYGCTNEQLKIVTDNILFWDGSIVNGRKNFSTNSKNTADFVQFAFSSCGYRASIKSRDRTGQKHLTNGKSYTRKSVEYTVTITDRNMVGFGTEESKIIPTVDGCKYCFEVPSHMLILRREDNIFITGNCGKSTIGIYNLVKTCCPEIWDYNAKKIIPNPCYQHKGGLYLQYEMNERYEVTPKIIASISGVPTYHILNGKYDGDEEARVDKAIEILHKSDIYIVTMPSFTVGLIENYIRDYILNHNVGYVVFDYVSEQSSVSSDIAKQNGVQTRSDQVLSTIASKLKDIAVENNVAIMTFTQTNANISTQEILDAGCIAGSRAVQNKADVAGIVMPLRKKEKEVCDMMVESKGLNPNFLPNRILHCYKMRFSSVEQGVKIWFNLNLNNGHVTDFWVTDKFDKPMELDKTKLVYK